MLVKPFLSTEVGGLMSYGARIADAMRQGGIYVGGILNGATPGDLPVVQAVKFEFVLTCRLQRCSISRHQPQS
jgi:putative tryptophan/tyrosine transport system substrate-binding protein